MIKWLSDYETSIPKIDMQHQKLVQLINDLFDAMNAGKSKEALGGILDELIKYTKYHFSYEEEMMKQCNYKESINHNIEHINFANKIMEFNKQFHENNSRITVQLMNFLKDWLINHIMITDKKYVECFKSIK